MKHEPLEIKNAILKELNLEIISDERGRRFPHPGIEVQFLAEEEGERNVYLAAFGENRLQNEVHGFLKEPRCLKVSPFVEISFVEFIEDAKILKKGFLIRYIAEPPPDETEVYLEVLSGKANRKQMRLIYPETFIGRCQKVSNRGVIVRVNDLYFPDARELQGKIPKDLRDAENINNSVSRRHARIKFIGGNYYLFDDKSSKGTSILPEGRGSSETVDNLTGIIIGHNDIISFGKAMIKVRIVKKS